MRNRTKYPDELMNAGKRHSGHWSSIGQWNLVNADTAKRTCHSVRIIRVFIRLITPVSYYVFLALSSAGRGLFVSEGGWGEKEKKARACYISITEREHLAGGEEIVLG